jgi:cell division septal protein FtsQ
MRPSKRRRGLAWLGSRWLSIVGAATLVVATFVLLTSPRFRVEQVTVRRESASADQAITRATQLTQVVGHNIFLLNTARVAREVAMVPSVLSARVVARFPNAVEIELVERVPIASWRTPSGAFLVDDQGLVLAQESGDGVTPGEGALVIRDTTGRELRPGEHVDQRAMLAARELARALPSAGAQAAQLEFGAQGLVVVTDAGWRVIFGDTEDLNPKLANLAGIVELARQQNLRLATVDLRPRDRPFFSLAP